MKILHIVSNLSIRNGVMSVLMNYYRNIDKDLFVFEFLYFDEREMTYKDEIKKLGGTFYKIKKSNNPFQFANTFRKFLINHAGEYDILHLHEVYLACFLIGLKKIIGVKKIISHAHATRFSDHRLKESRNRIMSLSNRFLADCYFACSQDAGKMIFGKSFILNGKVINNAIDLDKFQEDPMTRKEYRKMLDLEGKFVVGHVGNFTPQKNHFFLIDIFYEVQKIKSNAVLLLVGDGECRKKVIDKCMKLEISDKVIFLGARNDVNKIMNVFDCFVFPSIYEGLGIALIEAQATGVVCFFSDVVPFEANILKKSNRIMSLSDSSLNWAMTILNMKKCKDTDIKLSIRNAGYDITIEAKKLEQIYNNL